MKIFINTYSRLLFFSALIFGVICSSAVLRAADIGLLTPTTVAFNSEVDGSVVDRPEVIAHEYVVINASGSVVSTAIADSSSLSVKLLSEDNLTLIVERVEQISPGGITLSGGFEELEDGSFSMAFSASNTIVAGTFRVGSKKYSLVHIDGGVHALTQIDERLFGEELEPLKPAGSIGVSEGSSIESLNSSDPIAGSGDVTLDVLVLYTPAAQQEVGGQSAIESVIDLAVAETNIGFTNSDVPAQLRLVHRTIVQYVEDDSFATDLTRLTFSDDGYLDQFHAIRNMYGADLVVLIRESGESCGIGWLNSSIVASSFSEYAFSVTAVNCATGNYTFAHEIGHNLGSHHDRPNVSYVPLYPYSYGYIVEPSQSARTIMAYANECNGCTRLNRWSNPEHNTDAGESLGAPIDIVESAHNSLSLRGVVYAAANYRQSLEITANTCATQTPTISGSDSDDVLVGTAGPDVIFGYGGNDIIRGLGGDDILCGGSGDDYIHGNAGADIINGGWGADELRGGADNDTIFGDQGSDVIIGAKGDDTIVGGAGDDTIWAGDGNDSVKGSMDNDTIYGQAGNDYLRGSRGMDTIDGGTGMDTISGGVDNDILSGGDGDDFLDGLQGVDVVSGDAGDDRVDGGDGIGDQIHGGAGQDVCWDPNGSDQLQYNPDCETQL